MKAKFNFWGILFALLILGCTTLSSVPKAPVLSGKSDIKSLAEDEAKLFKYANLLNAWLVTTKREIAKTHPKDTFPAFEMLDNLRVKEKGKEGILKRINYFSSYILRTKPIVEQVFNKYNLSDLRL